MEQVLKQFDEIYKKQYSVLYSQKQDTTAYTKALSEWNNFCMQNEQFVSAYIQYRGDYLSSDREIVAFMFAVTTALKTGLLTKVNGAVVVKSTQPKGKARTFCLYWTSKTWTREGEKLTYCVYADFDSGKYKKTKGCALPNTSATNTIEVASKCDLQKFEESLQLMALKEITNE